MADGRSPTFYFDFNSPYAYLAAGGSRSLVPDVEWRPIAFAIVLDRLGELDGGARSGRPAPIVEEVTARVTDAGCRPSRRGPRGRCRPGR